MKRYRHRAERMVYIIVWSIILILGINVLVKGILILGDDSLTKSADAIKNKAVSAAVNGILESGMPILEYVTDKEQYEENGFILNTVMGGFPINRYIAQANELVNENYVQKNNSLLFTYGNEILFNNEKYIELIMDGIEQSKAATEEEREAEADAVMNTDTTTKGLLPMDIISGEVYLEVEDATTPHDAQASVVGGGEHFTVEQLLDRNFLYRNFYIVDSATTLSDKLFNAKKLIGDDMTLKATTDKPQILVYHTHSQEEFADSRPGVEDDTVVGLGNVLVEHLENDYGYNVIHDKSQYDIMGGALDRNLAYNYAGNGIQKILKKYPSIEVVIDIHRDGAAKRVTKINGENTAQIMLFNGLSRNTKGEIDYLKNTNLMDNLAFSLQLQLKGRELFPGLMYKNYLHAYRYNMHLRKKSILAEVGTDKNTIDEAKNSMKYLAVLLHEVLKGETDNE
ncbi:MAG: putative rane protein [Anaerocolumna sp.]|nr:putative rane protein [Anaerocolumna sp.]